MDNNTHIVNHPIIIDSLSHLRNKNLPISKFRSHSDKICQFLFAQALTGLSFKTENIETPVTSTKVQKLSDEIVIVPVLRSGIAMLFGAMQLLPKAKIGFVGMERDEQTAQASEYYWKLPHIDQNSIIMITDPMLATGGSIIHLLRRVKATNPKEIRIVCVISAPEGITHIHAEFPDIQIFTASVDDHLNSQKYIVPGLGDYGDRYFGTE